MSHADAPPRFRSFDEAWRWFSGGGALVPLGEQRDRFLRGRAQFLAFQAPVDDDGVHDACDSVIEALGDVDGLRVLPTELRHISIRGAGFQMIEARRPDEIRREDVGRVAERAARAIAATPPIDIAVGPVNVFPDALIMEVRDGGGLAAVRQRIGAATGAADALGDDAGEYLPHITLAGFADADVAAALRERLPALRDAPVAAATVRRIDFARWWFTGDIDEEEPEVEVMRTYRLRG